MAAQVRFDFDRQVIVVTGAAQGIGAACARRLAGSNARVVLWDVDAALGDALATDLRADGADVLFVACDVGESPSVDAALKTTLDTFGRVDGLVNNAGIVRSAPFLEMAEADWQQVLDVNLSGAFRVGQAVARVMVAAGGGAIVNFGSISWMLKQGGMPAYTASKSAMQGLTRSLARDLGPHRIRVNTLVPGWVMTEKQLKLWVTDATKEEIAKGQCIADPLMPGDIARMALFLAADDSAMCTAQDFIVDGGWA